MTTSTSVVATGTVHAHVHTVCRSACVTCRGHAVEYVSGCVLLDPHADEQHLGLALALT